MAIEASRTWRESWRVAAEIASRDPEVVIRPTQHRKDGRGLLLRKLAGDRTAIAMTAREGIKLDRHDYFMCWSWPRVFAGASMPMTSQVVDAAGWGQASMSVSTSPAAATALAIADFLTFTSAWGGSVTVQNRLERGDLPGSSYTSPMHAFPTAVAAAREEVESVTCFGGHVAGSRWWNVTFFGKAVAVVDSLEGQLHTSAGVTSLPVGQGVDGRKLIRSTMMRLVEVEC